MFTFLLTETRDSDFKNAFPGIFNFTVGILVLIGTLVQKFTHFINHQTSNNTFPIHRLVLTSVLLMYDSYCMIYIIWALPFGLGGMITALIAGDMVA